MTRLTQTPPTHTRLRGVRLLLVNSLSAASWMPKRWRNAILRRMGYPIGKAVIFAGCVIRVTSLSIGNGSFVNHGCVFDGDVVIGRDVFLSYHVTLAGGTHAIGPSRHRAGPEVTGSVTVEDGVWLGAGVTVLGGVRVARGCVVGAGALVTRDTEPDGLYVGVPARRVRDLDTD